MEEIIVAAHRLRELAELEMTPLTRARMQALIAEIGGLLHGAEGGCGMHDDSSVQALV